MKMQHLTPFLAFMFTEVYVSVFFLNNKFDITSYVQRNKVVYSSICCWILHLNIKIIFFLLYSLNECFIISHATTFHFIEVCLSSYKRQMFFMYENVFCCYIMKQQKGSCISYYLHSLSLFHDRASFAYKKGQILIQS